MFRKNTIVENKVLRFFVVPCLCPNTVLWWYVCVSWFVLGHENFGAVLEKLLWRHALFSSAAQKSRFSTFVADAYIQHNPDIPDGRQALIDAFIINRPPLVYEYGIIVAEGDIVGVQGRAEGFGPVTLVIVGTCFMDICHNY